MLHPQQRDIYVEPRMTKVVEARWQENLQKLKVGIVIVTSTEDNELGHQFCIGKVLDMVMHDNQNQIPSITVHWYNTRSKNAF